MSWLAVKWAFRDPHVRELVTKPNDLSVLTAIAHHADPKTHDNAYPSVRTLMGETRLSESAVRRALRNLRRAGVIEATGFAEPHGTTVYRVLVGGVPQTGGTVSRVGVAQTPKEPFEEKNPSELPPLEAVVKGSSGGSQVVTVEVAGKWQTVCQACGEVLTNAAESCPCEVFGQ